LNFRLARMRARPHDTPVNILIADDHSVVRAGASRFTGTSGTFRVIAEVRNRRRSHRQSTGVSPGCRRAGCANARCFGIEACRQIVASFPVATLLSSLHTLRMNCCLPPSSGASGYVLKRIGDNELISGCGSGQSWRRECLTLP